VRAAWDEGRLREEQPPHHRYHAALIPSQPPGLRDLFGDTGAPRR